MNVNVHTIINVQCTYVHVCIEKAVQKRQWWWGLDSSSDRGSRSQHWVDAAGVAGGGGVIA